MNYTTTGIEKLIKYTRTLKGDEKGEAQVFCDRLFQAFGHDGYKEAGAVLEYRVKSSKKSTRFADLLWSNRVLIEMKKRGTKLESYRTQAFDYWWNLRPESPEYVILCNFDEFIVYNFSKQDEPLDKIKTENLLERYTALNFLFPIPKKPLFQNNLIDVTEAAAKHVSSVFRRLIERGIEREKAQRFILQIMFAMFAEDIALLPNGLFTQLLNDCKDKETAYDLLSGLFRQMASPTPAKGGRFKEVAYFNGGLFNSFDPIELNEEDLKLLKKATEENWRKVHPAILGTIFQESMGTEEQHATGSHFTHEVDIYKVVYPTIVAPWREKIEKAKTLKELQTLRREVLKYKVLDPACGSGNFLYIAYRELKRIEIDILNKIHLNFGQDAAQRVGVQTLVSPKQFFGIDNSFFAVELAKVTLMLAKELSIKEAQTIIETRQLGLELQMEPALPLDNLDANIICADALFTNWPEVNVIIGNPPFQSKNKIKEELGLEYVDKLRKAYLEIPGRADYSAYWFYKAHKQLKEGDFAGLVATNTIRQNYSRIGSLDYIIKNSGIIFNAVSTQKWPGIAVVFVSIVCWKKGEYPIKKLLYIEDDRGKIHKYELNKINSSLSIRTDVTGAKVLLNNKNPKMVFQGQTHGHESFLVDIKTANILIKENKRYSEVLRPYLIGDEMLSNKGSQPKRYVIDFTNLDVNSASTYKKVFSIIERDVLPEREEKAKRQEEDNSDLLNVNPKAKVNKHHINFYNNWWKLSYGRKEMLARIKVISRYIACSRVSKRPIFEFISSEINPNDAMMAFAFEDDYSFGIIQSSFHILWYQEKCSTMKGDPRYTTESIWDTYPWPQNPTTTQILKVAKAARDLRLGRHEIMDKNNMTLSNLYKLMDKPGANRLKDLHASLDESVYEAYGFSKRIDILQQLLDLNLFIAEKEANNESVQRPGLPDNFSDINRAISADCVEL
ncbi:DNA methyltransferase [Paraflavisolibacter sp. H34]|uniref:class I SAM-dependent DNA methyltransferase n=1 Tax=Huijunlia imazamoxiresistens TaxID=3127457 RepID=UPI00301A2B32